MHQFQCIELGYSDSLQQSYDKLRDLPGFVLLESTDRSRGRYDILSAYPYDRIKITKNSSDIAEQLKIISKRLTVEKSELDLPFQGGAIGYIAYDLGAELAGLKSHSRPSLESMPLLDLGFYDWAIIADHQLKQVTLFAAHRELFTSNIVAEILALWHGSHIHVCQKFKLKNSFNQLISKEKYENSFHAIQKHLIAGRSYQVNLTQPFEASYEGDLWGMYQQITANNAVPFSAFMRMDDADILSFSPERFLSYDQGILLTSPIKGTIGRSNDAERDEQLKVQLSSCLKNRAENVMIVDLLRNDLGKIAKAGSVQVSNLCAVQSFRAVHHLVSDIKAQCLENIHFFDAFMSCFPGGSITGAPKLEAMHIINEEEPYGRSVYCGSLSYFSFHGRFDSNIAIRTITAKEGVLHLAAGGGLVIDSLCDEEYKECFTKILAITKTLDEVDL